MVWVTRPPGVAECEATGNVGVRCILESPSRSDSGNPEVGMGVCATGVVYWLSLLWSRLVGEGAWLTKLRPPLWLWLGEKLGLPWPSVGVPVTIERDGRRGRGADVVVCLLLLMRAAARENSPKRGRPGLDADAGTAAGAAGWCGPPAPSRSDCDGVDLRGTREGSAGEEGRL